MWISKFPPTQESWIPYPPYFANFPSKDWILNGALTSVQHLFLNIAASCGRPRLTTRCGFCSIKPSNLKCYGLFKGYSFDIALNIILIYYFYLK